MSDIDQKPPIPREEPPPPVPAPVEDVHQRTLRLLESMNVQMGTFGSTQATQGAVLEGLRSGLLNVVGQVADIGQRVEKLEAKSPPSDNPPPRTASGFTAAVRQISQTTESEPDKATAAQVAELRAALVTLTSKTDAQTHMLEVLVDGLGSFARNPTVRKIAYIAGGLLLGWLSHLAQKGLLQ